MIRLIVYQIFGVSSHWRGLGHHRLAHSVVGHVCAHRHYATQGLEREAIE